MHLTLPEREGGKAAVARLRKGYEKGGTRGYWQAMLELTREMQKDARGKTIRMAYIHARLGDRLKTLDYLEQAFRDHESDMLFINAEPYFDFLRGDPRFQELVRKVGLTPRA